MRILILGANGMAGHTITLYLLEQDHHITTFTRRPFPFGHNICGDLTDQKQLKLLLEQGKYDVVINCVGMLNSACDREPANAIYLNSYLPHLLAELVQTSSTRLIHMSTDCVFSGQHAPYDENSFPDGETLYDRTKALGELHDRRSLIFRNSIIGPDLNEHGIGLFNWFMKQNGSIQGYKEAIWTGVTTLTLAKAMEQAIREELTGLYHLVHRNSINKYDLLQLFNTHFKQGSMIITPSTAVKIDKTLINRRTDFSFDVPDYEQMVVEMKQWIVQYSHLYPHYKLIDSS